MKIVDLKCTVIGRNPVIRIDTDEGISGLGEAETSKPYLKPHVLFYKRYILGQDPTNVERVMLRIRRLGSFKPWGSSVSAIDRSEQYCMDCYAHTAESGHVCQCFPDGRTSSCPGREVGSLGLQRGPAA